MSAQGSHQPSRFSMVQFADADVGVGLGGDCVTLLNGSGGTLLVGDIVYVSTTGGFVSKANAAANYVVFAGVVVGGARTNMQYISDPLAPGSLVAANNTEEVLVQINGIARVVCDAAVASNVRLQQGATTAGRVDDPVFAAGQCVGISLESGVGAASIIRMLVQKM